LPAAAHLTEKPPKPDKDDDEHDQLPERLLARLFLRLPLVLTLARAPTLDVVARPCPRP